MKIPAIRAKIGNWTYYTSVLTFEKISILVKKVDDELHKSESLRDQIQRSITDNYKNIKSYILNQDERFFNSLVLAVYDGQPKWVEVEMDYGDEYFHNLGFLELEGNEKIFPVDGQHRVEGIKAALIERPELANEEISVILIGHKKDIEGMQKTRRLFTTLNRYAKPVKLNDIIALDEDDSVAIATRDFLENFDLFTGKRVNNSEQKALSDSDKYAITSLITLYECNLEVYKVYLRQKYRVNPTKLFIYEKQRYRPNDETLSEFITQCKSFWEDMIKEIPIIQDYLETQVEPAKKYRNNINGGNLLFRPIGLLPFVQIVIEIKRRKPQISYSTIFNIFSKVEFCISNKPWKGILWNPLENTMIMGNRTLIKLLLLYLFDNEILSNNELKTLKKKYAFATGQEDNIDNCLSDIK
ncbi:MAG: DNA sulfur modification protein DndB [Flavobacterium sp.]